MTYVVFHGSFNSYDQIKKFWMPELSSSRKKIIFPKFPTNTWEEISSGGLNYSPTKQTKDIWLNEFEQYYDKVKNEKDLTFIGHSTGPLFILHVLQKYKLRLNSAVFVSPFINPLSKAAWQVNLVNKSYYNDSFDFELLQKLCPKSYVVYGIDDMYVETENTLSFAETMKSTIIPINRGGHLNYEGSFAHIKMYV